MTRKTWKLASSEEVEELRSSRPKSKGFLRSSIVKFMATGPLIACNPARSSYAVDCNDTATYIKDECESLDTGDSGLGDSGGDGDDTGSGQDTAASDDTGTTNDTGGETSDDTGGSGAEDTGGSGVEDTGMAADGVEVAHVGLPTADAFKECRTTDRE